ncbi:MAG TPA: PilZ domain-containing protein [Terriglobales bacterium]|nr:PilZ domain-containing protein [Terriglobales bacterium]
MNSTADRQLNPSVTSVERRTYPRFTVQVQIELCEDGNDIPLRTETSDLSLGGCYVHLNTTLKLGKYINGRLWLNDEPVVFRGRVVTCHPQFGNGIMFLHFDGNGDQALARYLEVVTA